MTPEEAIKTIQVAIAEIKWIYPMDYSVAFETAIEALEKQIPKKPRKAVQTGFFWCSDCVRAIKMKIEDSEINISYCPFCGQALDWRDTE